MSCNACLSDQEILADGGDEIELSNRLDHTCGRQWPKYLNVYEVYQSRGGPEEGGWWYDSGGPLESVRVDDDSDMTYMLSKLQDRYEIDDAGNYAPKDPSDVDIGRRRGRSSAAGGYDIEIWTEEEFARPFPQTKPRYE